MGGGRGICQDDRSIGFVGVGGVEGRFGFGIYEFFLGGVIRFGFQVLGEDCREWVFFNYVFIRVQIYTGLRVFADIRMYIQVRLGSCVVYICRDVWIRGRAGRVRFVFIFR